MISVLPIRPVRFNAVIQVARPTRFERVTPAFGGRNRSIYPFLRVNTNSYFPVDFIVKYPYYQVTMTYER